MVLHGGGNTSVKTYVFDLSGMSVEGLHVTSGYDLADIEANDYRTNLAQLRRLEELNALSDIDMLVPSRERMRPSESALVRGDLHAFLPALIFFIPMLTRCWRYESTVNLSWQRFAAMR